MQEQEFAKGASFALALSLAGESVMDFAQELRDAKVALAKWRKKRKDKTGLVQFNVSAPAGLHAEIQKLLQKLVTDFNEPEPFLRGIPVEVSLLGANGKPVKQFTLGDNKAPAKPKPAPAPAEEDEGGSYGLAEAKVQEEEKPKSKAADEAKATPRAKLKKKKVQYAEEWLLCKTPFMLFFGGVCCWGAIWLVQGLLLVLILAGDPNYSECVKLANPDEKAPQDFEPGQFDRLDRVSFGIALLVGENSAGLGRAMFIIMAILALIQGGLWLTAYVMLLKLPQVHGLRGQAIALIVLGGINFLIVGVLLKLLPLAGVMDFVQLPLALPELPLSSANVERVMPIQILWAWHPFWAYFFAIPFLLLTCAEGILFAVLVWTVCWAMNDEPFREKSATMMQLGLGQAFILLAFHMLTMCGTSDVLTLILWIVVFLWKGFMLGFLISFGIFLFQVNAKIDAIQPEESERKKKKDDEDDDEEYEDDDEDEYEDD